jgi:hypothetical protein
VPALAQRPELARGPVPALVQRQELPRVQERESVRAQQLVQPRAQLRATEQEPA